MNLEHVGNFAIGAVALSIVWGCVAISEPVESDIKAQPAKVEKVVQMPEKDDSIKTKKESEEIVYEEPVVEDDYTFVESSQEQPQETFNEEPVLYQEPFENVSHVATEPKKDIVVESPTKYQEPVVVEQPKTLEELDGGLWVTLVNISKTVDETPNPYWTVEEGQQNFERMANKLHSMGGVPRDKGVK